jgi:hypothetical protein
MLTAHAVQFAGSLRLTRSCVKLPSFTEEYVTCQWLRQLYPNPPTNGNVPYCVTNAQSEGKSFKSRQIGHSGLPWPLSQRRGRKVSAAKLLYLVLRNISKEWTMPPREWKLAMSQFVTLFDVRFRGVGA